MTENKIQNVETNVPTRIDVTEPCNEKAMSCSMQNKTSGLAYTIDIGPSPESHCEGVVTFIQPGIWQVSCQTQQFTFEVKPRRTLDFSFEFGLTAFCVACVLGGLWIWSRKKVA
jgi:hypothetical protein